MNLQAEPVRTSHQQCNTPFGLRAIVNLSATMTIEQFYAKMTHFLHNSELRANSDAPPNASYLNFTFQLLAFAAPSGIMVPARIRAQFSYNSN
jgi:hypothetical protein